MSRHNATFTIYRVKNAFGLNGWGNRMGETTGFPQKALRAASWRVLEFLRWLKMAPREQHMLRRIGYLRHVQHVRETGPRQNPDSYSGYFITALEKLLARLEDIERVRKSPLFHFLLARMRFYDRALNDAIGADFKQLVFLGVGADTRSFRFCDALDQAKVRVIESDIQPWLSQRKRLCQHIQHPRDFYQLEFDLEHVDEERGVDISGYDKTLKTLFIAEGVTPYISKTAHRAFLRWVSETAPAGSRLVYDAKFATVRGNLGKMVDKALFRMPKDWREIKKLHDDCGLNVTEINSSAEVQKKFTPYEAPVFGEDVFVSAAIK